MRIGTVRARLVYAAVITAAGMALASCAQPGTNPTSAAAAGQPLAGLAAPTDTPAATASGRARHDPKALKEFEGCLRDNGVDVDTLPSHSFGFSKGADDSKVGDAMRACHQQFPDNVDHPFMRTDHVEMMKELAICLRNKGIADAPRIGDDRTAMNHADIGSIDPATWAAMEACHNSWATPSPSGK